MKRESGFTLVEMIATLVLVSLLAVVAGMGLIKGLEGYLFVKDTTVVTQKAQIALERMRRELVEVSNITSVSGPPVVLAFSTPSGSRTITHNTGNAEILLDNDTLVDNVNSFNVAYLQVSGAWVAGTDAIRDLTEITINLALDLPGGDPGDNPIRFTTSINPRNTGNANAPIN